MTANIHTMPTHRPDCPAADTPAERLAHGGGWLTLILALHHAVAMTEALSAAAWSEGLDIVRLAVLGGALLGFLLSLTRWDGFFAGSLQLLRQPVLGQHPVQHLHLQGPDGAGGRPGTCCGATASGCTPWSTAGQRRQPDLHHAARLPWLVDRLPGDLEPDAPPDAWSHAIIPAGLALLVNAYFAPAGLTGLHHPVPGCRPAAGDPRRAGPQRNPLADHTRALCAGHRPGFLGRG